MYTVETVPLPYGGRGRTSNPIAIQMRKLSVGESFTVRLDDPNWTGTQVRNENMKHNARYVTVREGGQIRIGRVE